MILSTMRVSKRPVCFDNPVIKVPSQWVLFKPFEGQPRMFKDNIRLPSGEVKDSTQKNAGMGFFVTEDVNEGQVLTMYAQNVIPEWEAEILKRKVLAKIYCIFESFSNVLHCCLNLCRAIDTFVTITRPVAS